MRTAPTQDEIARANLAKAKQLVDNRTALWAGEKAQNAPIKHLERGRTMSDASENYNDPVARDAIFVRTGTFMGPEGRMRWEMDDSKAKWKATNITLNTPVPLENLFDHEELYKNYPFMRSVKVKFIDDATRQYYAVFDPSGVIEINVAYITPGTGLFNAQTMASLLHEIQHGIQLEEGHAGGTSLEDKKHAKYYGEQEAYNTSNRMRYTKDATAPMFYPRRDTTPPMAGVNPSDSVVTIYENPRVAREVGRQEKARITSYIKSLSQENENMRNRWRYGPPPYLKK